MALTNWNDILNKPNGIDEVPEIALTVEQLSTSVLSISEDVGEIAGDVQEIALEVSQLSASVLPMGSSDTTTIKDNLIQKYPNLNITTTLGTEINKATLYASGNIGFVTFAFECKSASQEELVVALPEGWATIREGVTIRDNDNGNLVLAYVGSGGNLTTFNHVGTMTIGHLFFASMKAYKN